MINNLYHLLTRKIVHQKLEPYPHPVKWKADLDKIIILVSIIGPFSAIPQVVEIWLDHKTAGVSVTSWSMYIVLGLIWLFYGMAHKEKPIIINSILWLLFEVLVVIGVVVYS